MMMFWSMIIVALVGGGFGSLDLAAGVMSDDIQAGDASVTQGAIILALSVVVFIAAFVLRHNGML